MPNPPYSPSRVEIAIYKPSAGGLFWGRYPNGDKPGGLAGLAAVTLAVAAALTTHPSSTLSATAQAATSVTGVLHSGSTSGIKFVPGHYSSITGGSLASWISSINSLDPVFSGVQLFPPWAMLEGLQGDYSPGNSAIDQIGAACKAKGVVAAICIAEREFGSGFPGANGDGTAPPYVANLPGANGGWWAWTGNPITFTAPVNGTSANLTSAWTNGNGTQPVLFSTGAVKTATFTNGSTLVTWSGSVSAGTTAGWGNTNVSGGLRFMTHLDTPAVASAHMDLWKHFIGRYESAASSPYSEQIVMFETDETTVGPPGWNIGGWNSFLEQLIPAARSAGERTGCRLNANFVTPNSEFDTLNGLCIQYNWFAGGPDPQIPPGPGPYTRDITYNEYFIGAQGTRGDLRNVLVWIGEQQELGFNRGYTPQQVGSYQINTMRCSIMMWVNYTVGTVTPADTIAYIKSINGAVGISTLPPGYLKAA